MILLAKNMFYDYSMMQGAVQHKYTEKTIQQGRKCTPRGV